MDARNGHAPTPNERLGMLTPSSNTVLEPVITRMAAGLPEVSLHFSRSASRRSLSRQGRWDSLSWNRC
jgi:maleate cis-trans isomerase